MNVKFYEDYFNSYNIKNDLSKSKDEIHGAKIAFASYFLILPPIIMGIGYVIVSICNCNCNCFKKLDKQVTVTPPHQEERTTTIAHAALHSISSVPVRTPTPSDIYAQPAYPEPMKGAVKVASPSPFVPVIPPQNERERLAPVIQKPAVKVELSEAMRHQSAMIHDFNSRGLNNVAMILAPILQKFPDHIQSWNVNANDEFILRLNQPIRYWMPSQKNPQGMVVQIGCNNEMIMKGKFVGRLCNRMPTKLDKPIINNIEEALREHGLESNAHAKGVDIYPEGIVIDTGFYFSVDTKIFMVGITESIHVSHVLTLNDSNLFLRAGVELLGKYKGSAVNLQRYQSNLERGRVVPPTISSKNFISSIK